MQCKRSLTMLGAVAMLAFGVTPMIGCETDNDAEVRVDRPGYEAEVEVDRDRNDARIEVDD